MSDAPPDLLLHIGYHKTGSTWLQRSVFGSERMGFCLPWRRAEVDDWFVLCDPFEFDPKEAADHFAAGAKEAAEAGLVPVISHERLVGNPHSGGYDGRVLAERLTDAFPRARVLIVIREQVAEIVSCYKQFVAVGGPASIRRYLTPPRTGRARVPLPRPSFFEYHRVIRYYQQRIGRSRVLVLPFELLAKDPVAFVSGIADFAGSPGEREVDTTPANVAISGLVVAIKRHINRVFVRDAVNPWAPFDIPYFNEAIREGSRSAGRLLPRVLSRWFDRRLQARVRALCGDRFRASNRLVSELTGLDLGPLGYDV